MEDIILKTDGLTKNYRGLMAVNGVSMTINRGDIYGFVGLNGSGKTTFIRLITGLIKSSGGSYSLFGAKTKAENIKNLSKVSSMVETPSIYMNLNALDNLKVQCSISDISDNEAPKKLLELVGLDPLSPKLAKNFSLGMRQRLGIAVCLVGNPELLILDEPTNGLDPEGIIEIRELLIKLNKTMNITILVSSHILSELGKLATRFGFIQKGKLIQEITREDIQATFKNRIEINTDNLQTACMILEGRCNFEVKGETIIADSDMTITEIVELMKNANVNVMSVNKVHQDLESYFINLIGGKK